MFEIIKREKFGCNVDIKPKLSDQTQKQAVMRVPGDDVIEMI